MICRTIVRLLVAKALTYMQEVGYRAYQEGLVT
jgi:hypothetical protein